MRTQVSRAGLVGILVAGLLAACAGIDESPVSGDASSSAAPTGAPTVGSGQQAEAVLDVLDTVVAVRPADADDFGEVEDGGAVVAGDTVRTGATGFGELRYRDGSLTRVDVDSEVTITALDDTVDAVEVTVTLDVGRVWSRVRSVEGSDGRYDVGTDVGTAAVRGTAFDVDCRAVRDGACWFAAYEGSVEVTPVADDAVTIGPFEYVIVLADGTVGERGAIGDGLGAPGDVDAEWVRRNAALDATGGAEPIEGLEPAASSLVLGAIYECGSDEDATSYYRFFADGEVITVASTGTAEQIDGWFVATSERSGSTNPDATYGVGTYTLEGDRLEGSTTDESADSFTISFAGTVADDGTMTVTESNTSGHVGEVTCTPAS